MPSVLADDGFSALLGVVQSVVSTLVALACLCHWTGEVRERCVICSVRCRHTRVGMRNSHGESKSREWRASRISLSRACSRVTRARFWLLRTPSVSHTSPCISECYKRQSPANLIRVNNLNDHRVDNVGKVTWPVPSRRTMRKPYVMDLAPRLPSLTRFLYDRGTYTA
jgi:hypothetical protein